MTAFADASAGRHAEDVQRELQLIASFSLKNCQPDKQNVEQNVKRYDQP